jgi:hypothetical protein
MNKVDKELMRRECARAVDRAFEEGKIAAWKHIICLCNSCVMAHKEILREINRRGKEGR